MEVMRMEGGESATTAATRIFVGGLGESVGEADLHKTFSSLGIIKNIEFVRSRGRSFAHLDFQPSSPVSLAKLFSTYNGCVWKGGRLRLEKAKEHYLARLKREWAEDEMDDDDRRTNKNTIESEPSKARIPVKMQIHLFFPKLGKLKALPYTGTGKHKYSFRRIEVPSSLPINFCDCEEHSGASKSVKEKQVVVLEDKAGSVNEEERSLMSSVMNNIFERSLSLRNMHKTTTTVGDRETTFASPGGSSLEESRSDEDADSDNLVMNLVGSSGRRLGLLEKHDEDMVSKDQVLLSRKRRSKDGPNQGKVKAHKGDDPFSHSLYSISKKQVPTNSSNIEETTHTEPNGNGDVKPHLKEPNGLKRAKSTKQQASIHQSEDFSVRGKSSSRELVSEKENSSLNKSNIVQSTPLKDLSKSIDLNAVEQHANENIGECSKLLGIGEKENLPSHFTDGSIQATSGTPPKDSAGPRSIDSSEFKDHNKKKPVGQAWMQKSSWRELVGGVGSSSFSISTILPGIQNLPKSKSLYAANSMDNKAKLLETELTTGNISSDACLGKNGNLCIKSNSHDVPNIETSAVTGLGDSQLHETTERNSQNEKVDTFFNGTLSRNENHKVSDKRLLPGPEIGASCTFMRSAASEKDWIKTRAALRGGLKKKSSDK